MAELLEYKCPCCNGSVEFNSALQKPVCPYCDSEFEIEELKKAQKAMPDESVEAPAVPETNEEGLLVYVCKSCGGEIVTDSTTSATDCPYCGNPIIMTGQLTGELRPDLVIPFKLDKKAAKEALKRHLTGKPLLPKVFKDENHINEIKGMYVPFWVFDAHADASFTYNATKVRRYRTPSHDCTETKYYSVRREGGLDFKNIPVDGSEKMSNELMESVEPFDVGEAVPFDSAYLSGYFADRYDVSAEDAESRGKERVFESADSVFRDTVNGYSTVTKASGSADITRHNTRYVLYPVWLLNTTWNDSKYTFAMNGQTGKFVGNLPIDKGAYWRHLLLGALISGAVVFTLLLIISLIGG